MQEHYVYFSITFKQVVKFVTEYWVYNLREKQAFNPCDWIWKNQKKNKETSQTITDEDTGGPLTHWPCQKMCFTFLAPDVSPGCCLLNMLSNSSQTYWICGLRKWNCFLSQHESPGKYHHLITKDMFLCFKTKIYAGLPGKSCAKILYVREM